MAKSSREKKKPKLEKPMPAPAASRFAQQLGRSPAQPSGRKS
jgi:hypothetical protein